MKLVKLLLCVISLWTMGTASVVGQSKSTTEVNCRKQDRAVERKDDRFNGEASVTLKPQPITTAALSQQLKIALEYKIKPEGIGHPKSFIPEMVNIVFTSEAPSRVYERELELVFLIDGQRVRRVPAATHDDYSRLSTEKILKQTIFTGMTVETLRRISRAKTVEMKLGDTEVKLNSEVLDTIRSFAGCALASN